MQRFYTLHVHQLSRFELHLQKLSTDTPETARIILHFYSHMCWRKMQTFLQYFPLPGLLGERLFAVFDKKQIGEVDYEEFVCGLAVTCRGSWEEKVEFIFNIYDVHSVGAVSREELTALVSCSS